MYKITDIASLGTEYTVSDSTGKVVGALQIVNYKEILAAMPGEYSESEHGSFSNYIETALTMLSGFEEVDPNRVLWYPSLTEEVDLTSIIEYAIKHGYDKVVLEHLKELH